MCQVGHITAVADSTDELVLLHSDLLSPFSVKQVTENIVAQEMS